MKVPTVDRRGLLVGGATATGLVIAYALWPRATSSPLRAARDGEQVLGPFLKVAADGRVTVAVPQAETGQGIWTGLAQIAADELGAAWDLVAVEPAPMSPLYANAVAAKVYGADTRLTAGSSSVRAFEGPLRAAAATARALLCAAAAEQWRVSAAECDAVDGFVVHEGKRLGFGTLADRAARIGAPASAPLRPVGSGKLAGQPLGRVDLAAKSDGSWRFAGDVRLPNLAFASVRIAPPGGRLTGFDRAAAARRDIRLVVRDGWLAAIGPTWWAADQALQRATPQFTGPADADTPAIDAALAAALDAGGFDSYFERGDYDAATEGRRPLAATYAIAPAPHLSIEPPAAVARFTGGRLELWAASQAPDLARAAIAREAGLAAADVIFYPMGAGDGGGGAIEAQAAAITVELAREARRPVALTIPAATAQNHYRPRPPLLARMSALPDAADGLSSWHAILVGAAGLDASLARLGGKAAPRFVPRGAIPPYAVPAVRIESATAALPIATGYFRGDVEALASFATESFIDELARARGVEPLAFRIGLLAGQPRLAQALLAAARIGGWDGGGRGSAMGIACASAFGSHIGLLAEASLGPDQRVRVNRLVAAVDCGRAVNPGLVRQQVESGLLHALVTAAGPAPSGYAGMFLARPLGALGLGRLHDLPKVEVELVDSGAKPGGVSGLGALVLAAAVGNALFAGTGMRLRRLPFDPMSPA
jgi:isoquinoline 1-oxidoreductase beta subunit